jgi:hypothetical protein
MYMYKNKECVVIHYIHGLCNGNAAAVVQEYDRNFSNWQTSDWQVISDMHGNLQQGAFPKLTV